MSVPVLPGESATALEADRYGGAARLFQAASREVTLILHPLEANPGARSHTSSAAEMRSLAVGVSVAAVHHPGPLWRLP